MKVPNFSRRHQQEAAARLHEREQAGEIVTLDGRRLEELDEEEFKALVLAEIAVARPFSARERLYTMKRLRAQEDAGEIVVPDGRSIRQLSDRELDALIRAEAIRHYEAHKDRMRDYYREKKRGRRARQADSPSTRSSGKSTQTNRTGGTHGTSNGISLEP